MPQITTIEIDKETHNLVRQYCTFNNVRMKNFISELLNDKLHKFKQKIDEIFITTTSQTI